MWGRGPALCKQNYYQTDNYGMMKNYQTKGYNGGGKNHASVSEVSVV